MSEFAKAKSLFVYTVNESLKTQFKLLLEEKHLYQSVVAADPQSVYEKLAADIVLSTEQYLLQQLANKISDEVISISESPVAGPDHFEQVLLSLQNVKLYCSQCKARETFSPTWHIDATNQIGQLSARDHRIGFHPRRYQLFAFVYQCETCRSRPVSFLIERHGWKLTITGRSPFEEVEVAMYIPKPEKWLFSEAIVAAQTGNVLAGLFYLRSFIEQFGRRQTGITEKQPGETILELYQKTLPEKVRDHMPSLKSWYEKLSVPLHSAKQDIAVFDEARKAIEEHFDFRRLYKIPDAVPPAAKNPAVPSLAVQTEKTNES
jgi:hypothetical protein